MVPFPACQAEARPEQPGDYFRVGLAQALLQHTGEQAVVAVPLPLLIQRQQEEVGVLELFE